MDAVNNNQAYYGYYGQYIQLTKDIDMTGVEWTPIGYITTDYDTYYFQGIFDGQGNTITGLNIDQDTDKSAGLLGLISNVAVVRNVTLESPTVKGGNNIGTLIGYSEGGSVSDCHVQNVTLSGGSYVGGLIGYQEGMSVTDCSVTGTVNATGGSVGGVIGYSSDAYSDYGDGPKSNVEACSFSGTINVPGPSGNATVNIGGVVGGTIYSDFSACYASGSIVVGEEVTTNVNIGGFVGQLSTEFTTTACYTTMSISSEATRGYTGAFAGTAILNNITACYYANEDMDKVVGNNNSGGQVDCTEVTDGNWSTAMTNMNAALSTTGWQYISNSDTNIPLIITQYYWCDKIALV